MMKVLIFGGAGFIGSNMCKYLIERKAEVFCFDNLSSGNLQNIEDLQNSPQFHFIHGDIIKPIHIAIEVDYIIHLASLASPVDYYNYPIKVLLANSIGTYNIVNIAKEQNIPLIFSSSSEIYGDPKCHPQVEEYIGEIPLYSSRSCYSESKRFAETLLWNFISEYHLNIKIARLFNVYGPGMRNNDGRVIPNFITAALQDNDLEIYGDGSQTRSFCYIDDITCAIYNLLISDYIGPVNIGNPYEKRIIDLAKMIIKLTNSNSKIIYKPALEDDPIRRCPDISLASEIINWQPIINLENGLNNTIKYFNNYHEKE